MQENSADGNGITPSSANYLLDSGVNVITLGNHSFRRKAVSYTHLDVYKRQQREIMDEAIWKREKMLREEGYKPRILAVDEFAIHKGHSYATCRCV